MPLKQAFYTVCYKFRVVNRSLRMWPLYRRLLTAFLRAFCFCSLPRIAVRNALVLSAIWLVLVAQSFTALTGVWRLYVYRSRSTRVGFVSIILCQRYCFSSSELIVTGLRYALRSVAIKSGNWHSVLSPYRSYIAQGTHWFSDSFSSEVVGAKRRSPKIC